MSEINEDDIFTQDSDPIPTTENYNDDSIVHLEDMEHIRRRPGMYIGKLGDGASQDDGIYVLIKEVVDNSIDEFTSGFGKKIEVRVDKAEKKVSIRDYGRGIPLGKLKEAVSQLNTGAKYDSKVFQKSVGCFRLISRCSLSERARQGLWSLHRAKWSVIRASFLPMATLAL